MHAPRAAIPVAVVSICAPADDERNHRWKSGPAWREDDRYLASGESSLLCELGVLLVELIGSGNKPFEAAAEHACA